MAEVGKATGKKTQANRKVYETPDGKMVSERSTTFKHKGKWVNVPTIHNGYSYDDDTLRMMLDAEVIQPTSTHKSKDDAINAAVDRSKTLKFNEGGAVMDDQTVRAFAIGGLAEDIDPVSGNEVPVGSMPEEVRDDIPAQLSEGEYVVPADVVRFFGVKLFEDLRMQAKMGFQQMEANGRIGGEPIGGMEMGSDELPFDIAELQMVDDDDTEQPMMNEGGYVSGYADGGAATQQMISDFDRLLGKTDPTVGMQYRVYTNDAGNAITIPFFNGMPMSAIPSDYYPEGQAPKIQTVDLSANDNDRDPPVTTDQSVNFKELSAKELRDMVDQQTGATPNVLTAGLAMLNPLLGGAFKAAMWHQSNQVEKELRRRVEEGGTGGSDTAEYTSLLEVMEADQPSFFERIFGKKEEETAGVAEPTAVTSAIEEAMAYTPPDEGLTTTPPYKGIDEDKLAAAAKESFAFANVERAKRTRLAEKAAEKVDKSDDPTVYAEQVGGSQAAADAANSTDSELEEQYGMLNKGGLMKKKKNKKK